MIYSYVVARDYGFAPNPFFGVCTLCTCKPDIRRAADVGDWVVGTGSAQHCLRGHLIFAMCVNEVMTFNDYWNDERFQCKKPYLDSSLKYAFGDNIYHRDDNSNRWIQSNSHHSHRDGSPNSDNIVRDTKSERILISKDFVYFGREAPPIRADIRDTLCISGPGHKCRFNAEFVQVVLSWIRSLELQGYCGEPVSWDSVKV